MCSPFDLFLCSYVPMDFLTQSLLQRYLNKTVFISSFSLFSFFIFFFFLFFYLFTITIELHRNIGTRREKERKLPYQSVFLCFWFL